MRILFIITQSEFGGAQRFIFNLVNKLRVGPKYEITVATGSDGGGNLLKSVQNIGLPIHEIKHLKRNISIGHDILAIFEIRNLIHETKPDVLFLNSSKAGFIGALAAKFPMRIKNLKIVYRIGGWTFNDPWPNWKKKMWAILERISARWKDYIIVNCKSDYDQAHKLKIRPRNKLVLVHNGIDPYKINLLTKEEARLKLFEKISRQWGKVFQVKRIVGTIANLYPDKALEYFVETADYFKKDEDTIFVIIGEGQEYERLQSLIKTKGLEKSVFIISQPTEASQLLSAFDVFVLVSIKEGFSWSLLEAMTAKLPVISTDVGAAKEMIEDGKNGFVVEARKPEQIAARIKEIFDNSRLQQELGIQAHQTVLFKFSLDKMVSQIESLL